MTEEKIVNEAISKCGIPSTTTSERSCQSTSCGDDDLSNYNPMKTVIA
jgi:hypothetical protein